MTKTFLLVTVFTLIAFVGTSQAGVPTKTSAFEGWQGVHILYGKRGKNTCDLSFPEAFGYKNGGQLQELLKIIRGRPVKIVNDLECLDPPAYYALDQLRKLAVDKQD